ncbi:MAG: hypothetical protein IJY31_03140 [Muribaculaceae bacterium]|nr:hypothetical protein [Muribaculaceae bacterium]
MAGNLQQTLERIRNKAGLLTERYAVLRREKSAGDERIKELEAELTRRQQEIEKLQMENEYLKVVTTLIPDRKEVERSRAILAGLVREIDKCILELNE